MKKNLIHTALSFFMLSIYATPINGQWTKTNWPASNNFFSLYSIQNRIFARTWDSLNGGRMFLTSDNGANWNPISSADSNVDILSVVLLNNSILAGTWDGFYSSTLGSTNWNAVSPSGITTVPAIMAISMINTNLFAGTMGDIFKSPDNGTTWTEIKSGIPSNANIRSIVSNGSAIFAGSDTCGVFMTTNSGTSWAAVNSGLTDKHIFQLTAMGTKLFAITLKGVFVSVNNGTNWVADNSSLKNINCFLVLDNKLYAGTDSSGVYLSADSGSTWTSFSSGMPAGTRVWSLVAGNDNLFAGTSAGVWRIQVTTALKNYESSLRCSKLQFRIQNGSQVIVDFALTSSEKVSIEMYDLCGKKLISLVQKRFGAGKQSFSFDTRSAAPGSYIIRLTAGVTVYQQSIAIQR